MRSRTALIALLAVGALLTGAGGALGASALSGPQDATSAQYGAPVPTAGVLGETPTTGTNPSQPTQTTAAAPQAPRQASAGAQSALPFTGYAAIPLLLAGLGLLVAGMLLRRSTARSGSQD